MAPSTLANPEEYSRLDSEFYALNRPPSLKTTPLSLIHPIFGTFLDNLENYQPTSSDNALVKELRHQMSKVYDTEAEPCETFHSILSRHYNNEISLQVASVGSTLSESDGHIKEGDHLLSVAVAKMVGKSTGDAEVQCFGYFLASAHEIYKAKKELYGVCPCIVVYCNGPLIGFAGAAITDRANLEALTPMYPLDENSHENRIALQVTRAFGAYRQVIRQLREHYTQLDSRIRELKDTERLAFPYQDNYTRNDGTRVDFTYHHRLKGGKLIFFATTSDEKHVMVKFTRKYGSDAHKFCSDKGIAPQFYAMNALPGGWFMIVMEYLSTAYKMVRNQDPVTTELSSALEAAVNVPHTGNFVHGDIRDVNLMFSKENKSIKVMIVDLDWAGTDGEIRYPANVNTIGINRPDGARDGELISKAHDLYMLNRITAW